MNAMDQNLHLAQTLNLSPTLLQSMKILQMNTEELSEYLTNSSEENPVLEREELFEPLDSWEALTEKLPWLHDVPGGSASEDDLLENRASSPSDADSLSVFLHDQLSRLSLSPQVLALSKFLVDMLDEHGYLNEEEMEDLVQTGIPKKMLVEAIRILQSLEPTGIAARTLTERFEIQLTHLPGDHTCSLAIVKGYLEPLAKQNYEWIAKNLGVTVSQILAAEAEIKQLNPYPIQEFEGAKPTIYIRPDAWIGAADGKLEVFLNHWDLPQFRLSADYLQMMKQTQEEEVKQYLQQKVQQAQWLLHCVKRRHSTLEACLFAMAAWQSDYFSANGPLRPMTQYEIANQIELHPSTVSRAIRNKYLQCQQGLFPLSHFFSRNVGHGPEAASEALIKQTISQWIRQENIKKPLSDQMLTTLLQKNGIEVSRRTIAKYRSELGLPSSYRRKNKLP